MSDLVLPPTTPSTPSPRRWRGRALMAIAAGHTLVGLIEFPQVLAALLADGLFNTIGRDLLRATAAWFLLFGAVLYLLGAAIDHLERSPNPAPYPHLGGGLLLLIAVGVLLMPVSGFWLALPPAISLLRPHTTRKA